VFLCIFMVLLTWQSVQEAITMTAIAEVHQGARTYLPKWPGRWFLAAGSAIMAVYAAVIAIQKLTGEPEADAAKPAGRD
jgi:TRAP-type C4-dicarboxylate transport system permease small subunit